MSGRPGKLAGKVAIVTGSTSGIGRATAKLFAAEGARVVVNGRRRELGAEVVAEIEAAGGEATYHPADMSRAEEIRALVQHAVATYGRIDVLMNNAFSGKNGSVLEVSEEEWDYHQAVTLKAVYVASKYAIPEMIKVGGGAIVNTASVHGILAARHGAPYEAAKAGVVNLTRQMAVDFGPQGIRVNSICPGWIVVERAEEWVSQHPEVVEKAAQVYPVRRVGYPIDVARAALFLASDDSSFITGHALLVDGGMTVQLQDSLAHGLEEYFRSTLASQPGR